MGPTMTTELAARLNEIKNTRKTLLENSLGGETKDFVYRVEGEGIASVYEDLGKKLSVPIKEAFTNIVTNSKDLTACINRSWVTVIKLLDMAESKNKFSEPVNDYLKALDAWARGSGLDQLASEVNITPLEAALTLQDENFAGCQTAIVRASKDLVFMTHTEEDEFITKRMKVVPAAELTINQKKYATVCYASLLPGSATFGGSTGMAIACDYLRLSDTPESSEGIVNALSWVIWRMGEDATRSNVKKLIKEMGPFRDGYAINVVVKNKKGGVDAFKATVAGDKYVIEGIGKGQGAYLSQVSIISPEYKNRVPEVFSMSQNPFEMPEVDYHDKFLKRLSRIKHLVATFGGAHYLKKALEATTPEVHSALQNILSVGYSVDGGWGLANEYTGMACSAVISGSSEKESSLMLNLGPSLKGDSSLRKEINL